jgi:Fe-S cluster assembly scaffold protein SufB
MQLLIEIFVFIIFTKSLAKFFSLENVRIDHDSYVLHVYKIAISKQTTNFFFLFEIIIQTQIRVSIKEFRNVIIVEKKYFESFWREHNDQSTRQHLQNL